ncbi:MAG: HAMP domain-containing histidine kinase [Gammaproteobacteria bacterium]|nr:HAMP domain-containing histidine kinase [Gammaproteobacteria bacterium]
MKRYIVSLMTLVMIICIIIAWSHYTRYLEFNRYHKIIAEHSTHTVSGNINELINQRERLMTVFVKHHKNIIERIIKEPANEDHIHLLGEEIRQYFPSYFTYTISDANGIPILEDIESLVGTVCIQDLRRYMQTGEHLQRVHPSPHAYHFDIVAPFRVNNREYIFFVSFHTRLLGEILTISQDPSHRLYLAMQTGDGDLLLEAMSSGARNTEIRDSYILTDEELSRTLSTRSISNTRWMVIDTYTEELYSGFIRGLIIDALLYLSSFLIVIIILSVYLIRAERRKQVAEKHKDEFLSIVSHELRTPLTAINGSLSLISNLGDKNADKKSELMRIAISNTSKLTLLVNDILDLQKMESGKMVYQMAAIDLHALIKDSVKDLESFAREAGTQLKTELLDEKIYIHADKIRLTQVMYNLISNAIKYGASDDAILVTTSMPDIHHVRVSVIDHGPGISEKFKARLFDKFTQADSTPSRKYSGTGLGLSIVKLIIHEHHGDVGFHSEEGSGSIFYFDLPLILAPNPK